MDAEGSEFWWEAASCSNPASRRASSPGTPGIELFSSASTSKEVSEKVDYPSESDMLPSTVSPDSSNTEKIGVLDGTSNAEEFDTTRRLVKDLGVVLKKVSTIENKRRRGRRPKLQMDLIEVHQIPSVRGHRAVGSTANPPVSLEPTSLPMPPAGETACPSDATKRAVDTTPRPPAQEIPMQHPIEGKTRRQRLCRYLAWCLLVSGSNAALALLLWSGVGYGRKCLDMLGDMYWLAQVLALVGIVILFMLYLLDFYIPPHIPGRILHAFRAQTAADSEPISVWQRHCHLPLGDCADW